MAEASRVERLRSGVRSAALALGLGFAAVVVFSLLAGPLLEPAQAWLGGLTLSDSSRAMSGLALLSFVQALAVLALTLLVGLLGDWPPGLGARAGVVAGLLPILVLTAGQGVAVLLPWPLLAVRAAGVGVVALAGAAGMLAGRRLTRGRTR